MHSSSQFREKLCRLTKQFKGSKNLVALFSFSTPQCHHLAIQIDLISPLLSLSVSGEAALALALSCPKATPTIFLKNKNKKIVPTHLRRITIDAFSVFYTL
jgi:hypothetical protein